MPKHKNLKKGNARLVKRPGIPVDIGNPRQARTDTIKWLTGEGPRPEQFNLLLPDDREVLDRFREDLWVHPDRATGLGTPGIQFLLETEAAQKDLLDSRAARLQAEVTELEPTAKVGSKVIDGGRTRGLVLKRAHAERCAQWNLDLRKYYAEHPLTRCVNYRTEADRLLHRHVPIKWTSASPKYEFLRKTLLPPLLRELFPHLHS